MNLRKVRKKTKSIRNVRKITKAMQLVSAIKMKRSQTNEVQRRPYLDTLTNVIKKILPRVDNRISLLLKEPDGRIKKTLVILISSNKGLSGSFLVNLFRYVLKKNMNLQNTDFITIGSKGSHFVGRIGGKVIADYSRGKFLDESSAVFALAVEKFFLEEYKTVSIIYNKFISTFRFEAIEEILMPLHWSDIEEKKDDKLPTYLIEPSEQEIIDPLLRSYIVEKIRGAIMSSDAVEHASRMLAMKNATDNATDIIYSLTMIGNRLRQEKITNELLDMVTAKESVESV